MGEHLPVSTMSDSRIGENLAPIVQQSCHGRLSHINWFRTTWQRGGASTGYASYTDEGDVVEPVVVKVPVNPTELLWLQQLQSTPDLVPKLFACGSTLGPYDLAWVVMERLPHGPLGSPWNGSEFDLLIEAACRFYQASQGQAVTLPLPAKNWGLLLDKARKHIAEDHDVPHEQRWKNALKKAQKKLPQWLGVWNNRPQNHWVHGDLHLANALSRHPAPHGPAILIDFAQVHSGHWVEDAVYLEHLFWARKQRLGHRKLVSQLAHQRHALGLVVEHDWPILASIKRALLAMTTPAMLDYDGDPQYVQAALEVLEHEVGL